jgi:2-succinyl-6-hydroxy-2,4-cyclohexadiene-1-carboxylate synthase
MSERIVHVRGIDIHVEVNGAENLPAIVFIHGFTGSTSTWNEITKRFEGEFRTITVDLTGHGKTTVPEDVTRYSMGQQVEDLKALFDLLALKQFVLVGYSMGGRVALAYTVHYPERVSSLILESSSPGLKTEGERVARRLADEKLAGRLIAEGLQAFIDFWENIPLFASQKLMPEERRQAIRKERLSQSEIGLASSLRGIGTGSQPSYWEHLNAINLPVLLITGDLDTKYVNISREMQNHLPTVRHETIAHTGHAIHVEKPDAFATMIKEHVLELKNRGGFV